MGFLFAEILQKIYQMHKGVMHHCTISISPNEILDTEGKGSTEMVFARIHDSSLLHVSNLQEKKLWKSHHYLLLVVLWFTHISGCLLTTYCRARWYPRADVWQENNWTWIQWILKSHHYGTFHVIWSFRALLPYQRCWGEALWPLCHAEASLVWKR